MTLKLVPTKPITHKQNLIQRIKRSRPDGAIMCNRCGGVTMLTTRTGAFISKGRITGGTVVDDNVCSQCWKQGILSPMLPALKPVK